MAPSSLDKDITNASLHRSYTLSPSQRAISNDLQNTPKALTPEEKGLLRKLDVRIIPVLFWLSVLLFMDRVTIGNARVLGLEKSLHMSGGDYGVVLSVFLLAQVVIVIPANIIMKRIKPSWWLGGLCTAWGIVTLGTGFVKTYRQLLALRFLLGVCEGGFQAGYVYLISMYFKRYEVQRRFSMIFCGNILAGAVSGLFSYACVKLGGKGGLEGWRWIFVVSGVLTTVFGVVAKRFIVDWPEDATFLNEAEKTLMVNRMNNDLQEVKMDRLDAQAMKRNFTDWKLYCTLMMYIPSANSGYSIVFFMPTILNGLGYTAERAQVMSIPVYITAMIFVIVVAQISDRMHHRFGFILLGASLGIIGYSLLLAPGMSYGVQYMAVYFISIGFYVGHPLIIIWSLNNWAGHYKRSFGSALFAGIGNGGGFVASNIYPSRDAPRYLAGFGTTLGGVVLIAIMSVVFFFGLSAENKKRRLGGRNYRWNAPGAELENMGDDHPNFRFSY